MAGPTAPAHHQGYLREGEREALLIALPPVLVAALSQMLFDLNAGDLMPLVDAVRIAVASLEAPDLRTLLKASEARSIWNLALLLNLCASAVLVAVACVILWRSVSIRGLRLFLPAAILLSALGLGWLAYAAESGRPIGGIFALTYDSLMASPLYDPSFVSGVYFQVNLLNVFSIVSPVMALMAACSTLAPPKEGGSGDITFLAGQVRFLRALLLLGSCYMVAGVLHMAVWLGWPASLVTDPALAQVLIDQSMAITLFWGGGGTVLIASFYAPALIVLSKRAELAIARDQTGTGGKTPQAFLEEHGLSLSIRKQLPEILVVLAPLLAGPVGSGLADLAGVLPTGG